MFIMIMDSLKKTKKNPLQYKVIKSMNNMMNEFLLII